MTEDEFGKVCATDGWGEPGPKEYLPDDTPPMHQHDFDAAVLITAGELRMVYADHVDVLGPGDRCVVLAGTSHSEQTGADGANGFLATRKLFDAS